jgi:hypothetical protein
VKIEVSLMSNGETMSIIKMIEIVMTTMSNIDLNYLRDLARRL